MLCTSVEAGEPFQHPSGRLGDSRETEAVESGSGIFKSMFGCRFWRKVNQIAAGGGEGGREWMLGFPILLKVSFPCSVDFSM